MQIVDFKRKTLWYSDSMDCCSGLNHLGRMMLVIILLLFYGTIEMLAISLIQGVYWSEILDGMSYDIQVGRVEDQALLGKYVQVYAQLLKSTCSTHMYLQDFPIQKNAHDCGIFALKVCTHTCSNKIMQHIWPDTGSTIYHTRQKAWLCTGML